MAGIATLDSSLGNKGWIREKRHKAFDAAYDALVLGHTDEATTHLLRAGFTPEEREEIITMVVARERQHPTSVKDAEDAWKEARS